MYTVHLITNTILFKTHLLSETIMEGGMTFWHYDEKGA